MQSVPNVNKNVKFLSNLTEADPYTAENAMQREDPQEEVVIDIKLTSQHLFSVHNLFYILFFFSYFVAYTHAEV